MLCAVVSHIDMEAEGYRKEAIKGNAIFFMLLSLGSVAQAVPRREGSTMKKIPSSDELRLLASRKQ